MPSFREREEARVRKSGWVTNPSLRSAAQQAGLPPLEQFLEEHMTPKLWARTERQAEALREHFADWRFASEVVYGLLWVPDPDTFDTRGAHPSAVRPRGLVDDVDKRLGAGKTLPKAPSAGPWSVWVGVVGQYGLSAGSFHDVVKAEAARFTVEGFDTRRSMLRQAWGARLAQADDSFVPDSDYADTWTFTLLPGEDLVDGLAESCTVLKGKIRFRLGKSDRGIGSARVAPLLPADRR